MRDALLRAYKRIEALKCFRRTRISPLTSVPPERRPLIYKGDTRSQENFLCNAVVRSDGVIIGARSGGCIVSIDMNGCERTLLQISGAQDWRGVWMDSAETVFVSPYDSVECGRGIARTAFGIYRLGRDETSFRKVCNLSEENTICVQCTPRSVDL